MIRNNLKSLFSVTARAQGKIHFILHAPKKIMRSEMRAINPIQHLTGALTLLGTDFDRFLFLAGPPGA